MARGKKKESALTPEEKLAQALVPVEEQPYAIPQNWAWAKLETIVSLYNGDRGVNYPSKKDYVEIGIPFINAGAIQNNALDEEEFNYITEEKFESLRAGKIQKGDVLYCLRGSLGKTAIVEKDIKGAISSSLCILRCNEAILRKYFAYLLQSDVIHKQQDIAENGSAQPNLSAASVLKYKLPVPPLAEQLRIVDRIEYLFAKLDEAKEKAQSVLDSFETRKAAILHKAFTGELTAKWRINRNLSASAQLKNTAAYPYNIPCEWNAVILGELVQIRRGASPRPIKAFITDSSDGINWIKIGDADGGKYITTIKEKVTPSGAQKSVYVEKGTLLLSNSMSFGHPYILDVDGCIHDGWLAILPSVHFDKEFLYYELLFSNWYFEQVAVGTAVRNLNSERVAGTPLPICSIEEQKEIIRILDDLYEKEQRAKEAAEAVLEKIDLLKKSILARAFRGELGTNDPSEESALELLKTIL